MTRNHLKTPFVAVRPPQGPLDPLVLGFLFMLISLTSCNTPSNSEMFLVPANAELQTSAFYIDQYENSVTQTSEPQSDGTTINVDNARSLPNTTPKTGLNYQTASTLCQQEGKRICTFKEWIAACRGQQNLKYGFQREHDKPQAISAKCISARTGLDGNKLPTSESTLPTATGSKALCRPSDFEVYDLIGNVSEWTYLQDTGGEFLGVAYDGGVAAGGNYSTSDEMNNCNTALLKDSDADGSPDSFISQETTSTQIGFRCCKDAT